MRTTVDLPDELLRRAKARAALDGSSLKDLLRGYIEHGLAAGLPVAVPPAKPRRSLLPVARPATGRTLPALSSRELHRLLDEEETTGGRVDGPA